MILSSIAGAFALFSTGITAAPSGPSSQFGKRADCSGKQFHSFDAPNCWDGVHDLSTNYYTQGPKSGKTRVYDFELKNITITPDGVPRSVLAINDAIPGPTIFADWGDTVVVNVKNSLDYAGTAIHFHGIRQNHTIGQDGVASITQCPIPGDGQTQTYTWVATQYGTSWYHSHYAVQAWDGVFGAIVIRGPASAQYHEENDLGAVMLGDWTHQTADSLLETANISEGSVQLQNGLINGTNTYYKEAENATVGKRFEMTFEKDKFHRLRFVNTAIDTMYNLYFDDHEMQVISADFVSIEPFTTKNLTIAIGQRYDVIVKGSGSALKSWFRAVPKGYCGGQLEPGQDVRGIVRYKGAEPGDPAEKDPSELPDWSLEDYNVCRDVLMTDLKPSLRIDLKDVPAKFQPDYSLTWNNEYTPLNESHSIIDWRINTVPYFTAWEQPVIQQILDGNSTFDPRQHVIKVDGAKQWVYALIRVSQGTSHPIHLHGHDFFIIGQSSEPFNADTFVPQTVNPPRRDVAMVDGGEGYLAIAFETDNPGAWLLHCHIGWHTSEGMAMTFLEHEEKIKDLVNPNEVADQCGKWKTFATAKGIKQHDSGV